MTDLSSFARITRRPALKGVLVPVMTLCATVALAATALGAGTPPSVTLLSPVCGSTTGGTSVTITGAGFVSGDTVAFGTAAGTGVSVTSANSITVTSPAGSGTVDVTVTDPNGNGTSPTSSADQFTYAPGGLCAVQSVVPSCGKPAGGTHVAISGPGVAADDTVMFGSTPAAAVSYVAPIPEVPGTSTETPGYLNATAPPGSGTVPVTVTDPNGTPVANAGDDFTYSADGTTYGWCAATTSFSDPAGADFNLAGGHPSSLTTNFSFLTALGADNKESPVHNVKDITAELPLGFVANLNAIAAQCPQQDFDPGSATTCPDDSQVGWLTLADSGGARAVAPVYNVVPPPGHLAEFGVQPLASAFIPIGIDVFLDLNSNYQVSATIPNLTSVAPILGTALTIFGTTPGSTTPFLYFPGSPCAANSTLTSTFTTDSWNDPGSLASISPTSPGPSTGCGLSFAPALTVNPGTTQADAPAGYGVDLSFQQPTNTTQAYSPVNDISVTLPAGTTINPALANGAVACTSAQFGLGTTAASNCPPGSEVGTVTSTTPVIPGTLTGGVYLAQDGSPTTTPANPFHIFVEAAGSGLDVKLEGTLTPNPTTGQLTTTFSGLPPVPIGDIKLQFFGGAQAALANPMTCGPATTSATLTPLTSPATNPVTTTSTFTVDANGSGAPCPSSWPAAFGFSAGPTSAVAGASTGFTVTATRNDRQAPLTSLDVTTPPGFTGLLSTVPLCGAAAAQTGTCPAASAVGTSTVGVGVGDGTEPGTAISGFPNGVQTYLSGTVYLTGPVNGDPFGLSIVVQPVVGPFNLSTPFGTPVVVQAGIAVNPMTAQLTIGANLPTIQDGVPLHIRTVNVSINRSGFGLNPTNCSKLAVTGTISGEAVSAPYQVGGCSKLAFAPTLTATTDGATSPSNGGSLGVNVAVPSGDANLSSVAVTIPSVESARLSTTQAACPDTTFNANPTSCPATAVIGTSTAVTPILPVPLNGTVYEVSHGGAGLPSLDVVLQGEGVTVELVGSVAFTASGQTTSTFSGIPDVPITSFGLNLPEGPHSALASSVTNLCGHTLTMPTTLVAQNGATIVQSTVIGVTGCAAPPRSGVNAYAAAAHGNAVFFRVDLAKAGVLKLSGRYIKSYSRSLRAGGHRIELRLTKSGIAARKHHRTTTIKLTFAGQSMTVKVRL